MGIIVQILQYQEANYPEIMCRAYVINGKLIKKKHVKMQNWNNKKIIE